MKQRKNLFVAFATTAVACLASAVAFLPFGNAEVASAEEATPVTVDKILMQEGASVRTYVENADAGYENSTGIRFRMYVDQATYDGYKTANEGVAPEVGMYFAFADELSTDEGQNLTSKAGIEAIEKEEGVTLGLVKMDDANGHEAKTVWELSATESVTFSAEVYSFNVVVQLPEAMYGKAISANGYIKLGDEVIYSQSVQTRAIATVASYALKNDADNEVLQGFVDPVVTEEYFNFANTEIVTDTYKQDELSLGLTKPKLDLYTVWKNSNPEVATVDEATGVITRVGVGTTEITATIGTETRTAEITVNEPAVVKVDSASYKNIQNKDIANKFISADENEIKDFTGGYTGNASRMYVDNNQNYRVVNSYTQAEMAEIAKDYNIVSLWIAVGGITESGKAYLMNSEAEDSFIAKAIDSSIGLSKDNNGQWMKLTVDMDSYIELLEASNYASVKLLHSWKEGTLVTEGYAYYYFGDIEFELVVEPELITIDTTTARYFAYDVPGDYAGYGSCIEATDSAISGFSGDYSGNGAQLKYYNNKTFKFKNTHTADSIQYVAKKYNTVSIWLGYKDADTATKPYAITATSIKSETENEKMFVSYLADNKVALQESGWIKVSISIEDYITCLEKNEYAEWCELFYGSWHDRGGGTGYLYIGDMFFENT